jgi:hypothetical protein
MKYLSLLLTFVLSTSAFASNIYLKKLVDEKSKSIMFLSCTENNNCKVLGGGAIEEYKITQAMLKIRRDMYIRNTLTVVLPAISVAINPVAIMSFMSVPMGLITLAGSSLFVIYNHPKSVEYREIKLLENKDSMNVSEEQVLEALDQILREVNGK